MTWNPWKLRRMVAIGCALLIAGCTVAPDGPQEITSRRQGLVTFIVRDETTGCEYLRVDGAVTPRLGADGKPACDARLKSPPRGDRGRFLGRGH